METENKIFLSAVEIFLFIVALQAYYDAKVSKNWGFIFAELLNNSFENAVK
jgi:hypothetical protein